MATTTRAGRAPRADAQRNRDHILDVAEQHFSAHGVSGSLDAIAKQAGVGAGTLYRHFPNRESLLATLLAARDDALVARRDRLLAGSVATADALAGWLDAVVEWASAFDGLPDPLRTATMTDSSPLSMTCEGFVTTTASFLRAAQEDGSARRDVRARDLFLAALAISWVRGAAMADATTTGALTALLRSGWTAPPTDDHEPATQGARP
ncbi:TetR family transcriptional regulator [Curtobacterium sp. VKM Ac-2861]|uniref:TetR/AcrR family transcriptional regulator n=1 Tax=unclassified Curtobacterium TaxID=257496 RepID=UPI0015647C0D|nr:TetR family transcriptional regulator [Curtobacterium sp. MWU13-2055]NQW91763.1 TetR family transcriptional regulator [Curtobacterium sp. VKM Ac-2861]